MLNQWQSSGMYEHPANHQAGVYGKVTLSQAGVYGLMVGNCWMSCPQEWAAGIHADETGHTGTLIIRNVPVDLKRRFKMLCVSESMTIQNKIIALMCGAVDEKGEKA